MDGRTLTPLSDHARLRLQQRGIRRAALEATIAYGRRLVRGGTVLRILGQKEVKRWAKKGVNLSDYVNLVLVCGHDDTVITVYRTPKLSVRAGHRPAEKPWRRRTRLEESVPATTNLFLPSRRRREGA